MTNKQKVFIEEYLKTFNATDAARRAGYSARTARQIGRENLTKPYILEAVQARIAEIQLDTDEALTILAAIARGDVGEFIQIGSDGAFTFDLESAKDRGLTRLIKEIEQRTVTTKAGGAEQKTVTTKLKLHDPQAAIEKVLRVKGKIKDPAGVNIQKAYVSISPDDWDQITDD
jgi:phage terminase small subunit